MKLVILGAPGAGKGTQAGLIADRLGIPLSTCGTRLARAKAHCKTYLTQPPKGGDDAQ